ncbi:hypothetical protein Poli38472_008092 [Pythium oligandrum]|uniref:Uncharacterized protein n=1 Tax=Pythium oligandrum TaxID=41045 RepID=A0A8K1CMR8_PYTOL|nr:hypothetical protein Poli38472_008092 [Pythium oligandrum]|eukprot:TMW65450.1 hypothetical protein Poli38472_008092 [Pythium oligandrum]
MKMPTWPSSVYDYDAQTIADEDAAEVDLRWGGWIRCRYCNGRKQKAHEAFSEEGWEAHKASSSHQRAKSEFDASVEPSGAAKTSKDDTEAVNDPSRFHEYADFSAAMADIIRKDTKFLAQEKAKHDKDAREEHRIKELLRQTTLLVLEQQEDMEHLRSQVTDLQHSMVHLQNELRTARSQSMWTVMQQPMDLRKRSFQDVCTERTVRQRIETPVVVEIISDDDSDEDQSTDLFDELNMFDRGTRMK